MPDEVVLQLSVQEAAWLRQVLSKLETQSLKTRAHNRARIAKGSQAPGLIAGEQINNQWLSNISRLVDAVEEALLEQ